MRHPFLRTLAGSAAPAATDPNFENVTLLLHGDGTNGGQNNTFVDGSTNNFTITRNGNTTQGTFSPYGDNWSNYFDGTDDYLSIADNANLRAGSGTFTIEAWIYRDATGAAHTIYAKGGASTGIVLQVTSTNVLRFTHTTTNIDSTGTIGLATWTHVAVVREGTGTNETKLYINGTQDGTGTVSTDFTQTEEVRIGTDRSAAADFNGYISNLRFVKGTAVYTGAFTVPTAPLTAISNTQLLTCKSNRFRDESANAFTVTRNNNVSVQRFSPFSPTAAYAAGTIGGSGYFDGTGDYLTYPTGQTAMLLGTSDWTFDAWVYRVSNTNTAVILVGQSDLATASGSSYIFYASSASNSDVYQGSNTRRIQSPNPAIDQWAHLAWVRTGGTFSSYLNGTRVGTTATLGASAINDGSTTYGGAIGALSTAASPFFGYIAGARLIKGSGGYDATSATITVPTSPPTAVTNTSLLLNFTNAAILDNAMMAVPETVGNAQISTSVKKYGTGSLYFDGTDDGLTSPYNPAYSFGTGDFTIEAWVYIAGNSSVDAGGVRAAAIVGSFPTSGTLTNVWVLGISGNSTTTGTGLFFQSFISGTSYTVSVTTTLSQTTWHHLAVARSGTTTKLFLNGSEVASGTLGNQNVNGAYPIYVGRNIYTGYPNVLNGYIDDLRITKGVARYTANFTAPTAAFPDL